jgi:hypothetical protein
MPRLKVQKEKANSLLLWGRLKFFMNICNLLVSRSPATLAKAAIIGNEDISIADPMSLGIESPVHGQTDRSHLGVSRKAVQTMHILLLHSFSKGAEEMLQPRRMGNDGNFSFRPCGKPLHHVDSALNRFFSRLSCFLPKFVFFRRKTEDF